MSQKPKRARTERREEARRAEKLAADRVKLARLETGGSPSLPIDVVSASVIEPQASSMPCARCGAEVRVEEHRAETVAAARLRVVRAKCKECGFAREVFFRIVGQPLH